MIDQIDASAPRTPAMIVGRSPRIAPSDVGVFRMAVFAERLRLALQLAQMRPSALAKQLVSQDGKRGVSKQAVYQALDGTSRSLSAENTVLAARATGVDVGWLATGQGTPRPQSVRDAPNLTSLETLLDLMAERLRKVPPGMRAALAANLSGWAIEGGATHYQVAIEAMLKAAQDPPPRAARLSERQSDAAKLNNG